MAIMSQPFTELGTKELPHISGKTDIFKKFEDFQRAYLRKIWGFIVIGNLAAAGDMTLHEILSDFLQCSTARSNTVTS